MEIEVVFVIIIMNSNQGCNSVGCEKYEIHAVGRAELLLIVTLLEREH